MGQTIFVDSDKLHQEEHTPSGGILISHDYRWALYCQAVIEGLITDPMALRNRSKAFGLNPVLRERALTALLLYGTGFVPLSKTDSSSEEENWRQVQVCLSDSRAIQCYLLLSEDSNVVHPRLVDDSRLTQVGRYLAPKLFADMQKYFDQSRPRTGALTELHDILTLATNTWSYQSLVLNNALLFDTAHTFLDEQTFESWWNEAPGDAARLSSDDPTGVLAKWKLLPRSVQAAWGFLAYQLRRRLCTIAEQAELASAWGLPILTRVRLASHYANPIPAQAELGESYRLYQIARSEVEEWPRVDSFGELVRLSNHKEIEEHRRVFRAWAQSLRTGDSQAEAEIRSELQAAKRSLCQLGRIRRISKWLGLVSVPAAGVDLSTGIPISPTLGGISLISYAYADLSSRRYAWMMMER